MNNDEDNLIDIPLAGSMRSQSQDRLSSSQIIKNEKEKTGKFIFEPPQPIDQQVEEFIKIIQESVWDQNLKIQGYQGSFKVEHFMMIEKKLRKLYTLRELSFIDTQIDKEHLLVLQSWISWLRPQKLTLEFQQNEIDDSDIEEFIYFIFQRQIDIKRLFIISNPGIYKGIFLKNLKQFLKEVNYKHSDIQYRLIKNKDSKSIAIIKLDKFCNDQINSDRVQLATEKIDKTCFYSFHLDSCFNDKNYGGFEYLISSTYDLDNLEQICYLDVSNNTLGTLSSFQESCQSLSSAKGLLELHLKNQPLIQFSSIAKSLVGDSYDKLRVNYLNIESNSCILGKTFQILSNEIFLECKNLNFNGCLPQELGTLYKMGVIIEAFQNQIDQLKIRSKQVGKLMKMNLEKLDLSLIENYNRYDLVEKFLNTLVFNEYCNLKELIMQNCDIGRLEAWRNTFVKFIDRIEKEQIINPLLKDYKLPIKTFTIPSQSFRMRANELKYFFQDICFTRKGGILEIENLKTGGAQEFQNYIEEIYNAIQVQNEPFVSAKYTLKKLRMEDTTCDMSLTTYKCLLLTTQFSLTELTFKNDGWSEDFNTYYTETLNFLHKQPSTFIHSLTSLNLFKVADLSIEAYKFIELFVYNDQIKLKQLTLVDMNIICESENVKILEETIGKKTQNFYISLQTLLLDDINEESSQTAFMKYVILSKFQQIEHLQIGGFKLDSHSQMIEQFALDAKSNSYKIFPDLKKLHLKGRQIEEEQTWHILQKNLICNQDSHLEELQFEKINFDAKYYSTTTKTIKLAKQNIEQIKAAAQKKKDINKDFDTKGYVSLEIQQLIAPYLLKIKKLAFIECEFEEEFILGFWAISKIEELNISKCKGVEQSLKQTIKTIQNIPEINNCYPLVLTFEQITLDPQVLENFLDLVVFNLEFQKIKHLSFISCAFEDNHLKALAQQIHKIRSNNTFQMYYNLRSINLNGNGKISKDAWVEFFSKLMEKKNSNQQLRFEKKSESKEDENTQIIGNIQPKAEEQKCQLSQEGEHIIEVQKSEIQKENNLNEEIMTISDQIQQQLKLKELNLQNKIISKNQIFKPRFLQNMKKLSLECNFQRFASESRDKFYFKIVFGLIINPESELMELKLTSVDLKSFMEGVHQAKSLTSFLFLNHAVNERKFVSKLTKIDLDVKLTTSESVQSFINNFLCSNEIELKSLILSGFKNAGVVSEIINQRNNKKNYALEELNLLAVEETLTEIESFDFVNSVILGEKFPIKILKLGEEIIFKNPQLYELTFNCSIQVNVPLEEFQGTFSDNAEQIIVYQNIFELLFQSNCKLKRIQITKKHGDATNILLKIFKLISENISSQFTLQEFIIEGKVNFTKQLLKFILRSIQSLKKLSFDELAVEGGGELIDPNNYNEIVLEINKVREAGVSIFLDHFVFNDKIGFRKLNLKNQDLLSQIKQIKSVNQIQSLKLDMNILDNSISELNQNALTLLSQKFIYNEESQCTELFLLKLHLNLFGAEALTKPAQSFREFIERRNRKSQCQLRLKSIIIQYSHNLGDEGSQILFKDLYFFEYINLEKLIFYSSKFNDKNCMDMIKFGKQWIQLQIENMRIQIIQIRYPLKYLDVGGNQFAYDQKIWKDFINFTVFSDQMYLENLNISFMAIDDAIVQHIVEEGLKFFATKPQNYKLSIKKINFSQNYALTSSGWKNIFQHLFLHPKVDLLELNLTHTMLDTPQKITAIYECFCVRALLYPNKIIPMQRFLCFNLTLKEMVDPFLQKSNFEDKYLPTGIIYDEIPEELGERILTFNKVLYNYSNYEEIQDNSKLSNFDYSKFSTYHLDFVQHYLKVMNNYFKEQSIKNPQIFINLNTLDQLVSLFKYNTKKSGHPYPYMLVFQEEAFKFFQTEECIIYKINLIAIQFSNLEVIKQQHIIEIWKQLRYKKTSIDQIQIEYFLNDDLCGEMLSQGYTERDILQLVRIIPPKSIRIQGELSLSALKGLHSILHDTYYFSYSNVTYKFDTFLNTGIGYALREKYYYQKNKLLYKFFNFFVVDTESFEFDEEIVSLNKYLSEKELFFLLIAFNNILFWIVTLLLPYQLNHYYRGDTTQEEKDYYCVNGTSNIADSIYYGFAAFSFLIESYLVYQFQLRIPNHMEKFQFQLKKRKSKKLYKKQQRKSTKIFPQVFFDAKKVIVNKYDVLQSQLERLGESKYASTFQFLYNIMASQIFKLDLYNDIIFILTCYYCNEVSIFILSLIITSVTQIIYIVYFFYLILLRSSQTEKTAQILSTKFINDIYEIAFLGRNQALSTQLDKIAPYNVSIIPNNWITKKYFPDLAGKSMSNIVKAYFLQFILEDLPQTIIQIYFVAKQATLNGGLSGQVILIITTSLFNVVMSFIQFMSIRPSIINQDTFDSLAKEKNKEYQKVKLQNLRQEQQQLEIFTNLYEPKQEDIIQSEHQEQQQILN